MRGPVKNWRRGILVDILNALLFQSLKVLFDGIEIAYNTRMLNIACCFFQKRGFGLKRFILLRWCFFLGICFAVTPTFAETSYDLSASLPGGAVASQVEITDGHLQLSKDASNNFVSSGYIDISVNAADLSGKLIKLNATRYNALVNGDFSDTSLNTIYTFTGSTNYKAKSTGYWFSPSRNTGYFATMVDQSASSTPDYAAQMTRDMGIIQYVAVSPGENYSLSYDLDAAGLALDAAGNEQIFDAWLGFLDSSFHMLNFYDPYHHEPVCDSFPCSYPYFLASSDDNDDSGTVRFRIRTLDCDTHTQYVANTANYTSDVTFNFCKKDDGSDMETLEVDPSDTGLTPSYSNVGTYSNANDVAYMAVYLRTSWTTAGSTYSAVVDDINLDLEDQIKVELLDASGNILQSSTLAHGFYVEPTTQAATLRLSLKSHRTDDSPTVSSLTISDGVDITVTAGDQIATYTEGRMNSNGEVPPRNEYVDSSRTELRSLCLDPEDGVDKNCFDLHRDYNMDSTRDSFLLEYLEPIWSDSDHDYSFRIAPEYEYLYKYREQEKLDKGIDIASVLIGSNGWMFYLSTDNYNTYCDTVTDTTNECCYNDVGQRRNLPNGRACNIDQFADLNSTPARTGVEQSAHMSVLAAKFIANLYNDTTYTFSDGTTRVFPRVTVFEGQPEVNSPTQTTDPYETGLGSISAADYIDLQNQMAAAVREARPDAEVTTPSVLVNEPGALEGIDGQSIDLPYALAALTLWDKDNFTAYALHPYVQPDPRHPEELREDWAELETAMTAAGWTDYPVYATEWGFTREIYDPYCNANNGNAYAYYNDGTSLASFSRGYGLEEFAKRVARQQLIHLSLPMPKSHYYAEYSNQQESGGYDVTEGENNVCWQMTHVSSFHLWDRREGSGILSGNDEPTVYEPNLGGKAYLTIARHVSVSSPYESSVALELEDSADDEHYYSVLLGSSTPDTYYLGLWWYKDFWYTPDKPFFNDTYGTHDDGFTGQRIHNIALSGFLSVNSATLVSLEDGSEQTLVVSNGTGDPVVNGAVFGEMPVLVKIVGTLSSEDGDGDGMANASDNCISTSNADQTDTDSDGQGDACDDDDDGDGMLDSSDPCPTLDHPLQNTDTDSDGLGDICDADRDNDGVINYQDNCIHIANAGQSDSDSDGVGDSCDDSDGDGISDDLDCNSANASIYPGAIETCNSVDDDCDGNVDEGVLLVFYKDSDGDGYGRSVSFKRACTKPAGYSARKNDCNDACLTCYPGARIILLDGKDNNCDGVIE